MIIIGLSIVFLIYPGYCQEKEGLHPQEETHVQSQNDVYASEQGQHIKKLISDLSNYKDHDKRMRAYYELTNLGEAVTPYLLENLKTDGYTDIMHGNHSYTMKVLEKIGRPVVLKLIESVSDEMIQADPGLVDTSKPSYVTSVVKILGIIRDERVIPFYLRVLKNSKAMFVQEAVIWELQDAENGQLENGSGDKLAVPKLDIKQYRSELVPLLLMIAKGNKAYFSYACYHALRLLGKLGDQTTIAALEQINAAISNNFKISLAIALYDIGSNKYLDVLDDIFRSKNIDDVRMAAAELLYFEKGYKVLIPKIIVLMNRESSFNLGETTYQYIYGGNELMLTPNKLPNICGEVLHVMTYHDFGASQGKWKKWWEKNKGLSREEWKKNRLEVLKVELEKAKPIARETTLEGLVGVKGEQVVDVVRPYLDFSFDYPDGRVCHIAKYAMRVVFQSESEIAKEILMGLLSNDDIWIGQKALSILKEYHDKTMIPHFLKFKQSYCQGLIKMSLGDCSIIESQIAGILLNMGDQRGLEILIELAGRNDYSQGAYIRQLRAYTQQHFGYNKDSNLEEKKEALKKWKIWYEKEGRFEKVKVKKGFIDRDWRM